MPELCVFYQVKGYNYELITTSVPTMKRAKELIAQYVKDNPEYKIGKFGVFSRVYLR